jgi:FkbM family methyltransferase
MAAAVAHARDIHSLEIVPATYDALRRDHGGVASVRPHNVGLGRDGDVIDFRYYVDSPDRSSAIDLPDGFAKEALSLPVVRGDDFLAEQDIGPITYLKIDVEGMEMDVLEGFRDLITPGTHPLMS